MAAIHDRTPSRKPKVTIRGSKRMKQLGMKRVELWFGPVELAAIRAAATRAGVKLAVWIATTAFHAAQLDEAEHIKRRRAA